MKMLPVQLSLNPPLGLWSDVLWRCPPAPPSQLAELKTQLPSSLPSDPKLWGREDVTVFLRFCEREFDLPKVDHDLFQMNGKALCLLTRADFGHRCPGAGDVLHNVLQMLIIESHMMQWHLPNSPVTPTSRYPLSPHSHPPTPTWPPIAPPESPFTNPHMHHFMAPNSVTLSPPPSVDSQASSPPQGHEQNGAASSSSLSNTGGSGGNSSSSSSTGSAGSVPSLSNMYNQNNTTSNSSNHSDSDEESYAEATTTSTTTSGVYPRSNSAAAAAAAAAVVAQYKSSPPTTPILKDMPQSISQQITSKFVNSWSQQNQQQQQQQQCQKYSSGNGNIGNGNGGSVSAPTTPSYAMPIKREFFPENPEPNTKCMPLKREFFPENTEPNTNGRLLWDFLQQLLNDRNQKYSDLIAWKCRDTGVFKIVDPAGLAKLWGIQKNHLSMNYDKMSRALRYYYRVNILRKVQGERHCYQFLRNPTELKNIKNISLLRQTINNSATCNPNGSSGSSSTTGGCIGVGVGVSNNNSSSASTQANNQSILTSTNVNSANWSLNHQNMSVAAAAVSMQQQQQQQQSATSSPQSPHRPSSRNNHNHHHHHHGLPAITSSAAAAAAVAAAAAAAYGPPPTSPLFMHAINGAFHYLSSGGTGQPPNSPVLPATPSEKLQFHGLNLESNGYENTEEMKPTDLSVAGSTEKRPYSSQSASEECYPLIRNADGLTTIKLIRYNDTESTLQLNEQHQQQGQQPPASPNAVESTIAVVDEKQQHNTAMENEDNENSNHFGQETMPTDLSK